MQALVLALTDDKFEYKPLPRKATKLINLKRNENPSHSFET